MSRPYRPCDLAEALRCEHCGADANEPGHEATVHRMDERLTWQCNRCGQQTWSPPLPAEYGEFVHQLDELVLRGELAGWIARRRCAACGAQDVALDRLDHHSDRDDLPAGSWVCASWRDCDARRGGTPPLPTVRPAAAASAAPADLNADRISTVRLRPHNGVSSIDVLRRLIRWGGRVKVDFDEVSLTLTGPDGLLLAARRDLTDHRLVHRTPMETR